MCACAPPPSSTRATTCQSAPRACAAVATPRRMRLTALGVVLRTAGAVTRIPAARVPAARSLFSPAMHVRPAVAQYAPALAQLRMLAGGPDRTVVGTCEAKIQEQLSPQELKIEGAYDDPNGSHISIYCISDKFEGKRSLARQQMVFKCIWEEMQGPVHAVDTMVLKAPSEV